MMPAIDIRGQKRLAHVKARGNPKDLLKDAHVDRPQFIEQSCQCPRASGVLNLF